MAHFYLKNGLLKHRNYKQASLGAEGSHGNGLQHEKIRITFSSCFRMFSKQSIFIAVLDFYRQIKVISSLRFSKIIILMGLSRPPLISEQFSPNICEIPVT